jgi:adenosine deaminase
LTEGDILCPTGYGLSADRIGHGLKLLDKQELLKRFIDKNIGVEMCPSSNHQIVGYRDKEYPLKEYLKRGLKVSVNTDNCGISRTTLSNEFMTAAELCGSLSQWDCLVLIRNSLSMMFADHETKQSLLRSFEDEIYKLLT